MVYQYVHDPLEVYGSDVTPLPIQVLKNETPVAPLGPGLATQQRRRNLFKKRPVQCFLDPALPHKLQKAPFIHGPSLLSLSVRVEYILGRGE